MKDSIDLTNGERREIADKLEFLAWLRDEGQCSTPQEEHLATMVAWVKARRRKGEPRRTGTPAAAPELLAALEAICAELEAEKPCSDVLYGVLIPEARAAIAKARGGAA